MQRVKFGNGNFYHIYNRGVDRRNVFLDSKDFDRFLQSMEVFNTVEPLGGLYIQALLERGLQKHLARRPTSRRGFDGDEWHKNVWAERNRCAVCAKTKSARPACAARLRRRAGNEFARRDIKCSGHRRFR